MRAPAPWLLAAASCLASAAAAQPLSRDAVPGGLRDWIPWVLDGAGERLCPSTGGARACLWPGRLRLEASAGGARFTLEAYAERALDLPLPGDARRWPDDVRLDGREAVVLTREGAPVVRLQPGPHRLEGRFGWETLPDSLPVPPAIALVDLSVDGRPVALPRRDESGLLLLRPAGAGTGGGEELRLQVFRHVQDGIPLRLETRLAFDVSGRARELALPRALPAGAVPVAVSGDLPARLDPDGTLRVQLRAGTFGVTLVARMDGRAERLAAPEAPEPWPAQEVWVFAKNEVLRQVELRGAPAIDPSRTELPAEWRVLPAFLLERGGALEIQEVRRGEPDAAPDEVKLARRLWLDQSGRGFSASDHMTGRLRRSTRVELLAPGELGRVEVGGEGQLVTRAAGAAGAGVELRRAELALTADSYLPRAGRVPAVGWDINVQALSVELNLPPGWRLLAAPGADQADGAWTAQWSLWAIFFVVLSSLLARKLLGARLGLVAVAALVLLQGEPGAPQVSWLFALGALALVQAAPAGRLRSLAQALFALGAFALLWTLLPFAVDQVRAGLFPQVPQPRSARTLGVGGVFDEAGAPAAPPPPPAAQAPATEDVARQGGSSDSPVYEFHSNVLSREPVARKKAYALDPHAVIQTGAGVPEWRWASYGLSWSGPVGREQTLRLLLLSPAVNLVLAFVRVLLALLLAWRLLAAAWPILQRRIPGLDPAPPAPAGDPSPDPPAPAAAMLLLGLLLFAPAARAQDAEAPSPSSARGGLLPDDAMLQELRERLLRAPACAPDCVSTARLRLLVEGNDLRLLAEVHAGALTSWPLPGPAAAWVPRSVTLDGQPAEGRLARAADGFLHLRVEPGRHAVDLRGPLPPADSLTLQFGAVPRRASASTPGWQIDGLRADGSADASVQLSRRLARAGEPGAEGSRGYEPWLEVTRVLDLGVAWNVETIVRRISPTGAPIVVKVPLLKGMLVTDREREAQDGELRVGLGRDETEARFSAALPAAEGDVTLRAPEGRPWSEVWRVRCGPVWQCRATGLPPVGRFKDGELEQEFRPWPGETLTLGFRRPQGAPGRSLTVDSATLRVAPGLRIEDATLTLRARASRPTPLVLTLPEGAEVQSLKIGDSERPIRPDGRRLTVGLDAGSQTVAVAWRRAGGLGLVHRVAAVGIGGSAVNARVELELPPGRWLWLVGGPAWGPAVLFWPYLVCVLLAAFALARVPGSPLGFGAWTLLGLGLTQVPLALALVVVGWFLAFTWRRERVLSSPWRHDLMQLGLAFWTLLALGCLYVAVHQGLLWQPEMQVTGLDSSDRLLRWYQDRVESQLPQPWVLSLPLWAYRLAMLAWSLALAAGVVRYLRWGFAAWSSGMLWRPLVTRRAAPQPPPAV
jgi:hypothetical protein